MRYVHTDIIAKDCNKLIEFYKRVFHCRSIGETRDLKGAWLDKMTGLKNAHITGEHLCLPGYDENLPTLEIFSYDELAEEKLAAHRINQPGIAHLAFEVEDVPAVLKEVLAAGGGQIGELVHAVYEDGKEADFVYATDIEGNIIELQSWK